MESSELRNPTQKRAIEKKQKILEYGFKLICKQGYYNTDAVQIAKYAGVSTGTVYQYFTDKRDIFMQGLSLYAEDIMFPIHLMKQTNFKKEDLPNELRTMIALFIKSHKVSEAAHEEIIALQHTDKEVSQIFKEHELRATETLVEILQTNHIVVTNIDEKAHLILSWIEDLCHEIIYHKHKNMNYDIMTDLVIDSILHLLK